MSLSRKDIIDYKTMNDNARKNEIEMIVIDDDFEREALDGWSENQVSIKHLKSLDRKIKFKLRHKVILLSITATILTSVLLTLICTQENNEIKSENEQKAKTSRSIIISKDSITSFQEIPQKNQIKPSKLRADFEEKQLYTLNESTEPNEIIREPIRLPVKNPEKIKNSISKRENLAKETYLNNLKVIDYRLYRSRPDEIVKNELGGTPADRERNSNESTNKERSIEYTYFSYLDKTLKYFNKNKYKIALNRFELILKTYPDDANALFYSAICLYNLNQFELCESRLLKLENNRFTNFDQEQQWYLLLVYKSLAKNDSFERQKEKLILENGFYSKAAKMLEY